MSLISAPHRLITPFTRVAILGAVALALLVSALAFLGMRYAVEQESARQWVDHSRDVIETLYGVRAGIIELETRQRGYLLTRDPAYLGPYNASATVLHRSVDTLQHLASDNSLQSQRAQALGRAVALKERSLDETLKAAIFSGPDAALDIIRTGDGSRRMDDVQSQVEDMLATERGLLSIRQKLAADVQQRTGWLTAVVALLALICAVAGARLAYLETHRRRRAAEEIHRLREAAEERAQQLSAAYREIARAKEEAEQANVAKARFLASAGHDLKSPLQVITMALYRLGKLAGNGGAEDMKRADQAVDVLARAFDQFRDAARLSSGAVQPIRCSVELRPLLAQVCALLKPLAEQKRLDLRLMGPAVDLDTDPDMLSTILVNLIGNAIKYTERGGVLVGARRRGDHVLVQVYDTGIGIPADRLEAIFEEFQQLNPAASDGVGLGLAIVKRTADVLAHPISVCSVVGQGSVFTVQIPSARNELAGDGSGARGARPRASRAANLASQLPG